MRVAFTHLPATGHVNPTLALTRELVDRGAEVTAFAAGPVVAGLERAGARCVDYGPQVDEMLERRIAVGLVRVAAVLAEATELVLPSLVERLAALDPDVVVHDSMAPWGRIAAARLGRPAVCSTATLAVHRRHAAEPRDLALAVADLAREWREGMRIGARSRRIAARWGVGLGPPPDLFSNRRGASSTLVYTSREFQPRPERVGARALFVGPLLRPEAPLDQPLADRLADGPLVYVSLGTLFNDRPDFLRACLAGLASHPGPVVVATGTALDRAALGPAPANTVLLAHSPQLALLSRARAFVTHAGMNSAMEALWHGVPMLCAPQAAEQPLIARRIVRLGAGERLRAFEPDAIAAALRRVLAGPYRARARDLGAGLRACGGAPAAADAVLAAAQRPRPG